MSVEYLVQEPKSNFTLLLGRDGKGAHQHVQYQQQKLQLVFIRKG